MLGGGKKGAGAVEGGGVDADVPGEAGEDHGVGAEVSQQRLQRRGEEGRELRFEHVVVVGVRPEALDVVKNFTRTFSKQAFVKAGITKIAT